jgi:hypothetical protein
MSSSSVRVSVERNGRYDADAAKCGSPRLGTRMVH